MDRDDIGKKKTNKQKKPKKKKEKKTHTVLLSDLGSVACRSRVLLPRSKVIQVFSTQLLTVFGLEAVDEDTCFVIGLWEPSAPTKGHLVGRGCEKSYLNFFYPSTPHRSSMAFFVAVFVFKSCFQYFPL